MGAFTSTLSLGEFSLLAGLEVQPLRQVMGASIFAVGWQPMYQFGAGELSVLSEAYNECRRLALARLLEEAQAVGADAVLAVRIEEGARDWAVGSIEFTAIGTAVRLPEALRERVSTPALTELTGQEFIQLVRAGYRPVGIAARTSVHYVPGTWQTSRATSGWGSWVNQELTDFTRGVYAAREKSIGAVTREAAAVGADGIVGVSIRQALRPVEGGATSGRIGLQITFHVTGTAIRRDARLPSAGVPAPPGAVQFLSARTRRPRRR